MQPGPHVSVILPVYNREHFVAACIESILSQTYRDFEIVIVDDGSTDGTGAVLREYAAADPQRIRLLQTPNRGPYAARNTAIAAVRGQKLVFADSDDRLHPEKLARQVALLDQNPQLVLAYTHYAFRDESGRRHTPRGKAMPNLRGDISLEIIRRFGGNIPWPTAMVTASAALAAGPFDTTFRVGMDREWGMRLAQIGPFDLIPEPLYEYTLHRGHISQQVTEREKAAEYVLAKALALLPAAARPDIARDATAEMHLQLARLAYVHDDGPRAREHVRAALASRGELARRGGVMALRAKILLGRRRVRLLGRCLPWRRRPQWAKQA